MESAAAAFSYNYKIYDDGICVSANDDYNCNACDDANSDNYFDDNDSNSYGDDVYDNSIPLMMTLSTVTVLVTKIAVEIATE